MVHQKIPAKKKPNRSPAKVALVTCAVVMVVVAFWYFGRPTEGPDTSPMDETPKAAVPGPNAPDAVIEVAGRWRRNDGGYILEILEGRLGGHLEAAYYNPRPINVSRAAWMERPEGLQIFVELNDQGYPGATYMLIFDPDRDVLTGVYNQPQFQQEFEVEFVRVNQ